MLYFVDGKNGSGKTLFMMHEFGRRLAFTRKIIVTNIEEVKLPEFNEKLQEFCREKGVEAPDLDQRLIMIRKDETPFYFRYRGTDLVLPLPVERDKEGKRLKHHEFLEGIASYFDPVWSNGRQNPGVIYVLDECQDYFGAREWAESSRSVSWHVGKHRHLDDDVFWITPCYEEVDAQLKRKCHEWWRIQNMYRMKLKGFRMPGGFKVFKYYSEPKPGQQPFETVGFKLGDGWENTYRTSAALGGNGKPETRPPGWAPPFWMMVAGLIAAVVLGFFVLWSAPKLIGGGIGHVIGGINAGFGQGVGRSGLAVLGKPSPMTSGPSAPAGPPSRAAASTAQTEAGGDAGESLATYDGVMDGPGGICVHVEDGWVLVRRYVRPNIALLDDGRLVRKGPPAHTGILSLDNRGEVKH